MDGLSAWPWTARWCQGTPYLGRAVSAGTDNQGGIRFLAISVFRRSTMITRRELLQYTAATAAVAAVGHATGAERQAAGTPLFPGFKTAKIKTSGATINLVSGGNG